jgi:hypothetical protein
MPKETHAYGAIFREDFPLSAVGDCGARLDSEKTVGTNCRCTRPSIDGLDVECVGVEMRVVTIGVSR